MKQDWKTLSSNVSDTEMGLNMLEVKSFDRIWLLKIAVNMRIRLKWEVWSADSATLTFAMAARPEAGSGWPMLDFVEPISRGSRFDWQNTLTMPFTSCGSPTYMQRDNMNVSKARWQRVFVCDFFCLVLNEAGLKPDLCSGSVGFNVFNLLRRYVNLLIEETNQPLLHFPWRKCYTCGIERILWIRADLKFIDEWSS